MPEAVKPQGSEGSSGAGAGGGEGNKDPVEERFAKLEGMLTGFNDTFAKFQKQLNFVTAGKRVEGNQNQNGGQNNGNGAGEGTPTAEQHVTLKSLKTELDNRDQRIREKAVRTEIRGFAKDNGIAEAQLPFFEAYIEKYHGKKLTTDADDRVVFEDELGEVQPFEVLGKKILSSAGGQTFLAPVETPGGVGQRNKQGVTARNSAGGVKPIQEWTVEDHKKNPELGRDLLRNAMIQSRAGQTIRT